MNKRTQGILRAVLYLVLFVALPRVVLSRLPAEILRMLGTGGFDLEAFVLSLTISGAALALIAVTRGFTQPRSVMNLTASISSQLVWFYLVLFFIGLGQPWSFGKAQITASGGPATMTVIFDIRFFVGLAAAILGLTITKMVLEHISLREQSTADQTE